MPSPASHPARRRLRVFDLVCLVFELACLVVLTHAADGPIFRLVAALTGRRAHATWPGYLHTAALAGLLVGAGLWVLIRGVIPHAGRIRAVLAGLRNRLLEPDSPPASLSFTWVDGLILAVFMLYGAVLFLDKIQGPYPYVKFGSDAGNIASFAAAQRQPGLFAGDELLADPANLRSYSTLNILILNWVERLAGNYALAFAWFIPVQTFITLAGFYLLGLALFERAAPPRRRFWAALLAVTLAVPYETNLLETWGIIQDPVTRFTFQALLPYLLALMLFWRSRPARWPLMMLLAGLMSFVHPVSTPAWAAAIWLGLLACLPAAWSWRKKAGVMLGLAVILVLALTPYAVNYLGSASGPRQPLSYDLAMTVITQYFPPNILDIPAATVEFIQLTWRDGLLPVALILLGILLALRWRDRSRLALVLLWLAGLLFVSLVVPYVEHRVEQAYHLTPLETELVRGLRYGVFFMLLFAVWSLAELDTRLLAGLARFRSGPLNAAARYGLAGLGILLLAGWLAAADTRLVIPRRLGACLAQGRLVCVVYDDDDRAIQAIREQTAPGAPVFTAFTRDLRMSYAMPVRYLAFRPLVYTYKDRGQLVTARSAGLQIWYDRFLAVQKTAAIADPAERLDAYIALARAWGASYVLADFKPSLTQIHAAGVSKVYENQTYLLLSLR